MEYSVVGSSDWIALTSVDYSPFTSTSSSNPAYTQSSITDGTGLLATGVDAFRFVYSDPTISGGAAGRGLVLQEIDIQGIASIPEPSAVALGILALLPLIGLRRR